MHAGASAGLPAPGPGLLRALDLGKAREAVRIRRSALVITQKFFERLPIIGLPAGGEMLRVSRGKAGMVENDSGSGALRGKLKTGNGIEPGTPAHGAPSLDDALARDELDLAPDDVAAE